MVEIDVDVEAAAILLQKEFEATKLVAITQALALLAPMLWGRYANASVSPAIIATSELHTPKAAIQ